MVVQANQLMQRLLLRGDYEKHIFIHCVKVLNENMDERILNETTVYNIFLITNPRKI